MPLEEITKLVIKASGPGPLSSSEAIRPLAEFRSSTNGSRLLSGLSTAMETRSPASASKEKESTSAAGGDRVGDAGQKVPADAVIEDQRLSRRNPVQAQGNQGNPKSGSEKFHGGLIKTNDDGREMT